MIQNILFFVDGGIGKNLAATAVIRAINKQYPDSKIIVVSGHPDVFINNPRVHKSLNFAAPYFYDDYIAKPDVLVLKTEPYVHSDYIYQKKHLIEVWCEQLGIPFDGFDLEFYPFGSEEELAKTLLRASKRPILLLQINGGRIPKNTEDFIQGHYSMYARDLPFVLAQKLTDALKDKYFVCVPKLGEQPCPVGANPIMTPLRSSITLAKYTDKFVLIDSFMQYAAVAFKKRAIVLWGGTNPKCLGFEMHKNIINTGCNTPMCHRPNSYLSDVHHNGKLWECSFDQACMYGYLNRFDEIMEELV
jgi:hypothetical protein